MPEKQFKYLVLLLATAAILYIPALKNQFNNWDDDAYVQTNPNLELSKENIKKSFLQGEYHRMYVPLTALSHSIVYHFYGFNPKPYILVNLLLHLCNIALMFCFLSLLIKNPFVTFFTTALFALHPIQVESIAYAAGRRDVLYVFFYLLCIIFYMLSSKRKRGYLILYIFSILFALLALFSKGQALTIPVTLVLVSLFMGRKWNSKSLWRDMLPYFILSAVVAYKVFAAPKYASNFFSTTSYLDVPIPLFSRLVYACYGFIQYTILLLIPYKLSLLHPYPRSSTGYLIPTEYYLYVILLAGLVYFFFRYAVRKKPLWFGLAFYAVNIFMLLQLIPNSYGIMNDHYVYFAGAGIFLVITEGVSSKFLNTKYSIPLHAVFILYLLILCYLTTQRIPEFRKSMTIWNDVIKKYPREAMAYNNRGRVKHLKGDKSGAMSDYNMAIEFDQTFALPYVNRSELKVNSGDYSGAIEDDDRAIQIDPLEKRAFNNRGYAYLKLGNADRAIQDFTHAIAIDSLYLKAYINRGHAKFDRGDYPGAIEDNTKVISLDPRLYNPYYYRGMAEIMNGDRNKGCKDMAKSLEMGNISAREIIKKYCEQ